MTQSPRYRPSHPDEITFFRVSASNDKQGRAAAFSCKQRGLKSIYVIDDNEAFGTGLADVFTAAAKSLGLTILGRDHLTVNQQDFRPLLTRVAQMHPDAIHYGGVTSTGGALLRKQMAGSGFDPAKVPFVGSDGIYDQAFVKIAGSEADNAYFTAAAPNIAKMASAQEFIKVYRERYHAEPTAFAANAYVAVQVIIIATERAIASNHGRLPSRGDVLKHLRATKEFHSIVGVFGFDKNGDTTKSLDGALEDREWRADVSPCDRHECGRRSSSDEVRLSRRPFRGGQCFGAFRRREARPARRDTMSVACHRNESSGTPRAL